MPRTLIYSRSISIVLFAFSIVSIAGCQENSIDPVDTFDPNQPIKLKVMFPDNDYFYQRYGNILSGKFPNLEFEVIRRASGTIEDQKKQIIETQPDVLLLSSHLLEKLSDEGALMDLDSLIQRDKFDLSGIYSSVIEMLREGGRGKLYGLAPEFSSSVLYYNKDLFQQYGVDMPKDRMSWDDVLKLAQRFPTEGSEGERIYGYEPTSGQGLFNFVLNIGTTIGLTPISSDGSSIVIASDNWKKVIESVMQAYQSDVLHFPTGSIIDEIKNDLFLEGRVAMKKQTFFYYSLIEERKQTQKNNKPLHFDVVTVPVDTANPDMTDTLYLGSIYAVNNNSSYKQAAWEVVKYINSEEHAKLESKMLHAQMPVRKAYVPSNDDINIEPFFALRPSIKRWSDGNLTPEFNQSFNELATKELLFVADGTKSLDDALETLQTEGQQLLDSLRVKLNEAAATSPETPN